ncbi:MAG TPA: hypothetical protein VFN97_25155 [Actinospica sp.]|nr:hypothetical protein [Actinospica sp.]
MSETDTHATYALVGTTGRLVFRLEEPKQMLDEVTVGNAAPHQFTIVSASIGGPGMHGCITSITRPIAPPNPLAAAMLAALGGPVHDQWLGILGICGSTIANATGATELCGLIPAQQRLIRSIHAAARAHSGW